MTNSEIVEAESKGLGSVKSGNILDELSVKKFYSPLSVTGYLTPLQRKKLREKRNDIPMHLNDSSAKEVKKSRAVKRKKITGSSLHDKDKEHIKRIRTRDIQQVQCSISKIVHKTTDNIIKTRKFFKSPTADRLDKANFTMPLVLKKNMFQNIDRYVKETVAHSRKPSQCKASSMYQRSSLEVVNHGKDLELKNNVVPHSIKENLERNTLSPLHMSKNSEILRQSHTLQHVSVPEAKYSIFEFNWPSDEELLKRRERARELVRKNNVLREANNADKLTDIVNENKKLNVEGSQVKFYPVFQLAMKKQSKNNETKKSLKNMNKKMKTSSKSCEQMIIDAGQKEIGPKMCSVCNMIYTVGQEEDERLHSNYHNMHVTNLKFPGWKEENVVGEYCDGRVIMMWKSDKCFKLKKVDDVLQVANRDLGFPSSAIPAKSDLAFLLFISNDKMVAGCIVAEPISKAFRVLLSGNETSPNIARVYNWCSSSEAVPAICGVNRVWVAHNFRRRKVASRLVDCLRCHFVHGHVIGIREIAFTDPSPDGRQFATAYTGTANFLVYK